MNPRNQNKIKFLAYYQLIGGAIGVFLISTQIDISPAINKCIFLLFLLLYSFSIYCGWLLFKKRYIKGLKLSGISQLLQSLSFAALGFAFKYISGAGILFIIDLTDGVKVSLNASITEFELNINSGEGIFKVGINILAIYLVYYIEKLKKVDSFADQSIQTVSDVRFNKSNPPDLLLDVKYGNEIIDIHNDFICTKVVSENNTLRVYLEKGQPEKNFTPQTKYEHGLIEFKESEIKNLDTLLAESMPTTITNLSIGEIQLEDVEKNKKSLFVLSFMDTDLDDYEIIAGELVIRFW